MQVAIERSSGSPGNALDALIAESEWHGLRFVRRLAEEWASGANRFDRPGEVLLFARTAERVVVGVCGLNRDPYAGTGDVGRVRHLYVLAGCRGGGIGRQLVERVIDAARGRFDRLHLRTRNPAAARLYERLGFRPRSDVEHCTHVMEMR